MHVENKSDQRFAFIARVPRAATKEDPKPEPVAVEIGLHRVSAREWWVKAEASERDGVPEPVIRVDLGAVAKEHGISADALVKALNGDALFRGMIARGSIALG